MADALLNEYIGTQPSWEEKLAVTFDDFMVFYQEVLASQTPYFRLVYTDGQQSYGYSDLAQLNLEDARRVFTAYDDTHKGVIQAADLRTLMSDMGYSIVNNAEMDNYFTEIIENSNKTADGVLSFDEFVRVNNEIVEMI
eukprot:TRINITY_DN7021_c0_g1_i1.p1 TRINITY_DN7021_c0_g1~~TRINITY_DN7021_c0_g1_i1.p1  ORF type:complete len:139 (-),score=27.37 TRINITY_DN7021_c0_g1_i1:119-535(-)